MDDTVPAPAPRSRLSWIFTGDDGLRAGWSLVLFFLFVTLLTFGLAYLARALHLFNGAIGATMTADATIRQELLGIATVGIAALLMALIERRRFGRYNLAGAAPVVDALKGMLWGLVMLSALVGTLRLSGGIAFDRVALHGGAIAGYGLIWLIAFFLVGLFEEFTFRGYLQFTLSRGVTGIVRAVSPGNAHAATIGFWVAAAVFSIILFAVAHLGNGGETPMGIVSVSMAGLLLVFSLWWTGSLWWAIGFHCTWDWAQSYLYGVADSGMVSDGRLLESHAIGPALLSGGTTGPEGSVLVVPTVLIAMLILARTMPRRLPPVVDGRA